MGKEYLRQVSGIAAHDGFTGKGNRGKNSAFGFRDWVAGPSGMRGRVLGGHKRSRRLDHRQVRDLLVRRGVYDTHRRVAVSILACRHQSIFDESSLSQPNHSLLPG